MVKIIIKPLISTTFRREGDLCVKIYPMDKGTFLYKIRYQITIFLFFVTFLPVISIQLFNYEKLPKCCLLKTTPSWQITCS